MRASCFFLLLLYMGRRADMPLILEANQLACERGGLTLFRGLSFAVAAGEILHITGPNGSGKTSLLRILASLSHPAQGEIIWHGNKRDTVRETFLGQSLYLGHKNAIKGTLTALENLRWYFPAASESELRSALAHWQLGGYEDQPCYQLSQGQQQRVALCRLLLSKAQLWLLDEPFNAIDRAGVEQLEQLLLQQAAKGAAVILTTHHHFKVQDSVRTLSLAERVA